MPLLLPADGHRVSDTALEERHNLLVLETKLWINQHRKERLTVHHRGEGDLSVKGGVQDLHERMVKWGHLP